MSTVNPVTAPTIKTGDQVYVALCACMIYCSASPSHSIEESVDIAVSIYQAVYNYP